eukprot:TRINITY_DN465_c0_g1_i3.p1 TRINITY_DN465_c0_g1~~TRINITY_DN465_c0_g1_i3.p1  ORF type:complete len:124 (+),score=6.68 TRINITY_DN465_c0_g1_i3:317-688(+)
MFENGSKMRESPCKLSRKRSHGGHQECSHSPSKKCGSQDTRANDTRKCSWAPRRPTCIGCLKFFGTVDKAGCCSRCYASRNEAPTTRVRQEPALAGIDPNAFNSSMPGDKDMLSEKPRDMEID